MASLAQVVYMMNNNAEIKSEFESNPVGAIERLGLEITLAPVLESFVESMRVKKDSKVKLSDQLVKSRDW